MDSARYATIASPAHLRHYCDQICDRNCDSFCDSNFGPDQLHYSIHFNITLYYIILYCCFALFQLWGEGGRGRNSVQSKRDFCLNTHRPECSLAHKLQKQIEFTKHVSPVPVITQSPAVNMHCPLLSTRTAQRAHLLGAALDAALAAACVCALVMLQPKHFTTVGPFQLPQFRHLRE